MNAVFGIPSLVSSREMTSEERAQIPGSAGSCFSLVVSCGKFASTNQMQNGVMSRHHYGISQLVSQTKFRGETSSSVAKFRLFSQAFFWTMDSPLIQISEKPNKEKNTINWHNCYKSDYSYVSLACITCFAVYEMKYKLPSSNATRVHRWLKTWKVTRCRIRVLFWIVNSWSYLINDFKSFFINLISQAFHHKWTTPRICNLNIFIFV